VMRAGSIEQLGSPTEIYEHPASLFVADFVGRTNRIEGERAADGTVVAGPLRLATEGGTHAGPVTLAIRPHRIRLGEPPPGWNGAAATVARATYVGDVLALEAELPGGARMVVEQHTQPGEAPPAPGSATTLHWRVGDTLWFPRAGAA
jgi:putative spermidine/putrescine transport system ATP-binding protein